jgi:transposase InsO family protein
MAPVIVEQMAHMIIELKAQGVSILLSEQIPLSESHLRSILKEWVAHYNGARPHSALGPGIPDPPAMAGSVVPHLRQLVTDKNFPDQ